jgi:putative hydrolase of the HAD superfamily
MPGGLDRGDDLHQRIPYGRLPREAPLVRPCSHIGEPCSHIGERPLTATRSGQAERPLAVLFDSGGVLVRPIGGRWNPRADFKRTVLAHVPWITPDQFAAGIAAGDRFMAAAATTPDYDDYHRVILRCLGVEPAPGLLAELRRPVEPASILETFPEVPQTLRELRHRGVRMAVVSDAWPDLPRTHAALGIGEFFDAYAISAVLGCRKPDPRMYQHASATLGLTPAQCLFVDDGPALVAAAIGLGYRGRVVCRDGQPPGELPSITSLTELLDLV